METSRSALVTVLRQEIAFAIAAYSANDVPSLCIRMGLSPGTVEEAFASKRRYAESRLVGFPDELLLQAADVLLEDGAVYSLEEALAKCREHGRRAVSELTRRRIVAVWEKRPLCTEMDTIELLQRVWPLAKMPTIYPVHHRSVFKAATLEDDVYQAIIRNNDWANREILTNVGLLTCSQRQFFRFLEEATSPLVQNSLQQAELADAISGYLWHDGFELAVARKLSGSSVYAVREAAVGSPADAEISRRLAAFDPGTVHER